MENKIIELENRIKKLEAILNDIEPKVTPLLEKLKQIDIDSEG